LGWFDDVAFELDQPIGPPQIILNVDTVSELTSTDDPHKEYKYVFKLTPNHQLPLIFACETKNDLNEWRDLIQDLCPSSNKRPQSAHKK